MKIRAYTDADYEETVALWRAVSAAAYTFLEPHTEAEDRTYFREVIAKENRLFLAEDGGAITGYMALQGDLIDRLYIGLDRQGAGIGTALLEHARRLSPHGLRLFTHQKNEGARRFYERRGFVVARLGVSPPPESEPDVEYHWRPTGPAGARRDSHDPR